MDRDYIKYIFTIIIVLLIIIAGVVFLNKKNDKTIVDQTSTNSNIKKNVRIAISGFDTINPILSKNKNVKEISYLIYDSLVTYDGNLKLKYNLANEIGKIDNTNYIIKIKDDIYWSNGEILTAYDIKFTVDILKSGIDSIYADNLRNVSGLELIDDYSIRISLYEEEPFFEYYLTFPIMSSFYYEGENFIDSNKNESPIGTGMFQISSIEEGKIILSKNPYYWNNEKKPVIEQIQINKYSSMGDVYKAFKLGDIDIINVSAKNIEEYIGTIGYSKIEYKTRNYDFLSFNTSNIIFSEASVRKAINYIIDKNNIIATTLGNGYQVSNFFFDMESWLHNDILNLENNWDLGKQILETTGWEYRQNKWFKNINGVSIELKFDLVVNSSDFVKVNVANNIANQLKNIGITVNVKQVSTQRYLEYLNNKDYDCILTGVESSFSPNLERYFGENNIANYRNEEILNILNSVKNKNSQEEIKKEYQRLYEIYLEEMPYIGLYRETDYVVFNQGLICNLNPNSFNIFNNIEKWYRQ